MNKGCDFMMSINAIKKLCESKLFTHRDMISEIEARVKSDKILALMWETAMRAAENDEQRKAAVYMILNCNTECREIFATYLYYQMKA